MQQACNCYIIPVKKRQGPFTKYAFDNVEQGFGSTFISFLTFWMENDVIHNWKPPNSYDAQELLGSALSKEDIQLSQI